jgi:hypothetical protein
MQTSGQIASQFGWHVSPQSLQRLIFQSSRYVLKIIVFDSMVDLETALRNYAFPSGLLSGRRFLTLASKKFFGHSFPVPTLYAMKLSEFLTRIIGSS